MRLVLIGDGNSVHIKKWVAWYLRNGFELLLLTTSDIKGDFPDLTIVRKLPDPERKKFPGHWTLTRFMNRIRTAALVRRFRPDIVHIHRLNDYLNHYVRDRPLVFSAWGSEVYQLSEGSLGKRMLRRNIDRAALILGTTKEMVDVLNKEYGVSMDRLSHFSWGIDLVLFPSCKDKSLRKVQNGFDPDKTLFISPRGIAPMYRNDIIIKAFVKAHGIKRDTHLLILGNNLQMETYKKLRSLTERMGISEAVTMVDRRLELTELSPLLQASDFYVGIPRSDQLSSSLLEAMACGCIPIVNNIAPYRDLISHGRNGFVWSSEEVEDLAEIMVKAARMRNEVEGWRAINRQTLEREQDWEQQAKNLFSLYDRVLGRRGQV